MRRDQPVCVACGRRFQLDDFVEELGELVACPYCGSYEIEVEVEMSAGEERAGEQGQEDSQAHAA